MDAIDTIGHETARTLVKRALEAFLSDAPVQQRLAAANRYIRVLETYGVEDNCEVRELKSLADELALSEGQGWSEAHEFQLAERALALYAEMAGGALIF